MSKQTFLHYGIWYQDEAAFLRFKKACVDEDGFVGGYNGWLSRAENMVAELKKRGINLRKVYCDVDEFLRWCDVNSRAPDGRARSAYAGVKGYQDSIRDN